MVTEKTFFFQRKLTVYYLAFSEFTQQTVYI